MHRLVPALVAEMGAAYPELVRGQPLIEATLKQEETRFRQTLDKGLKLLDEATAGMAPGATLAGETAFKLYDTFGFPYDLTEDALRAQNLSVDRAGFDAAMAEQKRAARAAWKGSGAKASDDVWFDIAEETGSTEFLGYASDTGEGEVLALVKDGARVDSAAAGDTVSVIVNQTPFYGESGGQVGDSGTISSDTGLKAVVTDTSKQLGRVFVHNAEIQEGGIKVGDSVKLAIDTARRAAIRANHSATHLLHEALRQVLGDHIAQRGSLVAPERLRFDFAHNKPITADELRRIEDIANDVVLENGEVVTRSMAVDDARDSGARALFGEKYGDEVRVVSMGAGKGNALGWSVELCGGTHVRRTGDIGLISISGESAVASGVRRIEALTGNNARHAVNATIHTAKAAAAELKTTLDDLPARIAALVEERKKLERDLSDARKKLAMGGVSVASSHRTEDDFQEVKGVKLMAKNVSGIEMKDLKSLADDGKKRLGSGVVAIVNVGEDGKAGVVVGVTSDLTSRFSAVDLVKIASEALGGKGGGGRPDMAQAGGPDGAKADAALKAIEAAMGA